MVKKLSGVDTASVQAQIEEKRRSFGRISCKKNLIQTDVVNDREIELELMREIESIISNLPVRYIVLDFSCVNLIDTQSVEAIVKVTRLDLILFKKFQLKHTEIKFTRIKIEAYEAFLIKNGIRIHSINDVWLELKF